MSGIPETIAAHLPRYFERKLTNSDVLRCEPEGYHTQVEKHLDGAVVLHHVESGIRVCCDPLDLVERVDRAKPPAPTSVVFLYLSDAQLFKSVTKIAKTRPREVLAALVEGGALVPVAAPAMDEDGEQVDGEICWFGGCTPLDPAAKHKREAGTSSASMCIAFFVLSDYCRQADSEDALEMLDLRDNVQEPEVNWGLHLIEAASRRDVAGVRYYLEKGADPNFADGRGWTALHAAVLKRPCWPVLDILLEVCDVCARTRNGELPADLAEACCQKDILDALNKKMLTLEVGQHLVRDKVPLISNHVGSQTRDFVDDQRVLDPGRCRYTRRPR